MKSKHYLMGPALFKKVMLECLGEENSDQSLSFIHKETKIIIYLDDIFVKNDGESTLNISSLINAVDELEANHDKK